jgi:transposase
MLRDNSQMKLSLSPYESLYDIIIPQDHLLRKIKENIDFSFVNPMLRKQYCENFGRPAKEPEMMFKLMFLKKIYDLSDERLISSAQTDMAYKYFLSLDPEAGMIDPSLLTKFRKTRITQDVLEEMLRETIRQAIEKGIIKSTAIIVDSTHTNAAARAKSASCVLRDLSKQLRREIYREMVELSEKFPEKPGLTADLAEEIEYTYKLLENVGPEINDSGNGKLIATCKRIKELLDTGHIREIRSKSDEDARFGHKTATSTFFGYKNHLAMTEERLITGIEVTHGGEADCKQLPSLLEQSQNNGINVEEIIGDMAYVSEDNLDICEEGKVTLYARTNTAVASAAKTQLSEGFCFNKDAGLLQCPAGELATRVEKRNAENGNTYLRYIFSKVKCRKCPIREQCRVGKSKAKEGSYNITQPSEKNRARLEFEDSEEFRGRLEVRHRIEDKNGEMKVAHGLGRADSMGLASMRLQMYFTAFAVNVKRIVKLSELNPA